MTTIAADKTGMAADSQAQTSDVKTSVQKIWRIRGWLIGVAGSYNEALEVVEQLKRNTDLNPLEYLGEHVTKAKETDFLIVSPSSKVYCSDGGGHPTPLMEGFGAIGTGAQGAMVALHLGLSPADAVRAVKKVDPSTGGRVVMRKI